MPIHKKTFIIGEINDGGGSSSTVPTAGTNKRNGVNGQQNHQPLLYSLSSSCDEDEDLTFVRHKPSKCDNSCRTHQILQGNNTRNAAANDHDEATVKTLGHTIASSCHLHSLIFAFY